MARNEVISKPSAKFDVSYQDAQLNPAPISISRKSDMIDWFLDYDILFQ